MKFRELSYFVYCDNIIIRGGTNFHGIRYWLRQRNLKPNEMQHFHWIVMCNVWHHKFKGTWINAFCRNNKNLWPRIKVHSQYCALSTCMHFLVFLFCTGWSWSWSYLCNQCLSPLTLWVRIPFRQGVLDTTLCDKVCQWPTIGRLFSPGTPVSSTN